MMMHVLKDSPMDRNRQLEEYKWPTNALFLLPCEPTEERFTQGRTIVIYFWPESKQPLVGEVHKKKLQSSNISMAVRCYSQWEASQRKRPDSHGNRPKHHRLSPRFNCREVKKTHSKTMKSYFVYFLWIFPTEDLVLQDTLKRCIASGGGVV